MKRKDYILLTIIVLLFIGPLFYVYLTNNYKSYSDETCQFQAAKNITEGKGHVTNTVFILEKCFEPISKYLTQWPPAYPYLISGLHLLGFSIETSAKILKILTILFIFFIWNLFLINFK